MFAISTKRPEIEINDKKFVINQDNTSNVVISGDDLGKQTVSEIIRYLSEEQADEINSVVEDTNVLIETLERDIRLVIVNNIYSNLNSLDISNSTTHNFTKSSEIFYSVNSGESSCVHNFSESSDISCNLNSGASLTYHNYVQDINVNVSSDKFPGESSSKVYCFARFDQNLININIEENVEHYSLLPKFESSNNTIGVFSGVKSGVVNVLSVSFSNRGQTLGTYDSIGTSIPQELSGDFTKVSRYNTTTVTGSETVIPNFSF